MKTKTYFVDRKQYVIRYYKEQRYVVLDILLSRISKKVSWDTIGSIHIAGGDDMYLAIDKKMNLCNFQEVQKLIKSIIHSINKKGGEAGYIAKN